MSAQSVKSLLAGMDIGGTKTEVIIVDDLLSVCGQAKQPTILDSPEALVNGVVETIKEALNSTKAELTDIKALGVGIPGQVNRLTGEVQEAVNLGLTSYPLGTALNKSLKMPVSLENDVRLAALGVYHQLQKTTPITNMAYLSIGTGIAAGLIINGELYRGMNGMAGELGHIVVEADGPLCQCGQRGCLEAVAAGPAIVRYAADSGLPESEQSAEAVFRLNAEGDKRAQQIAQQVSRYLARAIQWIVMAYDVEKIVLGGGVTSAGTAFLNAILKEVAELRTHSTLNRMMLLDSKVQLLSGDFNPGTRGGVHIAQQLIKGTHT